MSSRTKGRLTHRVKERLRQRKIVKELDALYRLVPGHIPNVKKVFKVELVIRYINYLTKVCELFKSSGVLTSCDNANEEPSDVPEREETVQEAFMAKEVFMEFFPDEHWLEEDPIDFVDVETIPLFENDMNVPQENVVDFSVCPSGYENVRFGDYVPNILTVSNANTSWMDSVVNMPACSTWPQGSENLSSGEYVPHNVLVNSTNTPVMDPRVNMPACSTWPQGSENLSSGEYVPHNVLVNSTNTPVMDPRVNMPACSTWPQGSENLTSGEYVPHNVLVNSTNTPVMDPRHIVPSYSWWLLPYNSENVPNITSEISDTTPLVKPEAESYAVSPQVSKLEIQSSFCKGDLFGEILLEKVRQNFAEAVAAEKHQFMPKYMQKVRKAKSEKQFKNEYQNTGNPHIHFLYEKDSVINVTDIDPARCTVHVVKPSTLKHCVIKKASSAQRANKPGNGGLRL